MKRKIGALLGAVALVGATLAIGTVTPATAAEGDAIQRLGGCLAGGGKADILLVLDTSGSLGGEKGTDPKDDRVKAARLFVEGISRAAKANGADVDVAVAGFDAKFKSYGGWHDAAKDPASVLTVIDGFRSRDNGFETDYWIAADGARSQLAKKAGGDTRRCQAWVWFSDGRYELDKRSNGAEEKAYGAKKPYGPDIKLDSLTAADRVRDAGAADLCRAGGVADQLRVQRVITLAIGLKANGNANFDLMKRIATGTGTKRCGEVQDPVPGTFLLADRIGDLYRQLIDLSDPTTPGRTETLPVCNGDICPDGTHRFVLDSSISRVHLVGNAGLDRFDTFLIGPGGKRLLLRADVSDVDQQTASWTAKAVHLSDDAIEINLAQKRDDAGWAGEWRLVFVDRDEQGAATGTSTIKLYGDLKPALMTAAGAAPSAEGFTAAAGDKINLELGLVHADGTPVENPENIRSKVNLDVTLESAVGTSTKVVDGIDVTRLGKSVQLDLDKVQPGNAVLRLSLSVTTRAPDGSDGTPLQPQSVDVPVRIEAPAEYPGVPEKISFGTTEESGTIPAKLKIDGAGCAWVESSKTLTTPNGVKDLDVTSSASSRDSCASGSVPLRLEVGQVGAGLASGQLTVMTLPEDKSGDPVTVTVRYDLEMKNPRNDKVFWPVLIGITAAGILIPIGLLYLVKWRTAKLAGATLEVGSLRGLVGGDAPFLTAGALVDTQLRTVFMENTDGRSLAISAESMIVAKMGLGLTEPSFAVVTGQRSASSARLATSRGGTAARLPLAIKNHWVALLDTNDPHRGPVEVVFLVAVGSGKLPELLADARTRLPEVLAEVRSHLGEPPTIAPVPRDPWADPPGGQASSNDYGSAPPAPNDYGSAPPPPNDYGSAPPARGSSDSDWP